MEACVRSARKAGCFKEFHVLTDRPIDGCECYEAFSTERDYGLFKLHYLKAGMTRLPFEWLDWLDAASVFIRNPVDVLGCLGRSPVHVPLECQLSANLDSETWHGNSAGRLSELFIKEGVRHRPYLGSDGFWIVHHDAIEAVYELALGFWHRAKDAGLLLDAAETLAYAMQMLCGDPKKHTVENCPTLWAASYEGKTFSEPDSRGWWNWRHPLAPASFPVCPAIVHVAPCATQG
jgi:hypothetical protein